MQPLQYINYTETGNTRKPTLQLSVLLLVLTKWADFDYEKECTYYHELDYTEWCQFSKNEPTCTLDDVFVQLGFRRCVQYH